MVMGLKIWSLSNPGFEPAIFYNKEEDEWRLKKNAMQLVTIQRQSISCLPTAIIPKSWAMSWSSRRVFTL
jgi:hypothetical protein